MSGQNFFDFPELDLTALTEMPITVKAVNLDIKVEKLWRGRLKCRKSFQTQFFRKKGE